MRDFQKPERSEVFSSNGMIATSHPLAAKIGLDAMGKGGNAIDAAITSALMLVLCEPQSTGLFGDAFAIIKSNLPLFASLKIISEDIGPTIFIPNFLAFTTAGDKYFFSSFPKIPSSLA